MLSLLSAAPARMRQKEVDALWWLYEHTAGKNWKDNSGWAGPSTDPCRRFSTERRWALSNDEGHADAQVACATALLRAGASAKAANVYGLGPIHCAAACRRAGARLVELLIIYGADPNQSTGGGRTPLHAAAQHGHAATVHALLRAGADANFRGRYGTALDLANCPHPTGASRH